MIPIFDTSKNITSLSPLNSMTYRLWKYINKKTALLFQIKNTLQFKTRINQISNIPNYKYKIALKSFERLITLINFTWRNSAKIKQVASSNSYSISNTCISFLISNKYSSFYISNTYSSSSIFNTMSSPSISNTMSSSCILNTRSYSSISNTCSFSSIMILIFNLQYMLLFLNFQYTLLFSHL